MAVEVLCNSSLPMLLIWGPQRTLLSKALPGHAELADEWADRAPLGWDAADPTAVARTVVALLSDWLPVTTGEVVHADGGAHAVGSRTGG